MFSKLYIFLVSKIATKHAVTMESFCIEGFETLQAVDVRKKKK